ncbi:DNA-dependent ATPase I and helicase II [Haemophilus influenzae]|uniref:DNA-dependent ATPase I and helicase II n=1 Tax=Haemophilus influenzae TaxID=727 RepID=A0A2X1RLY8_HAEIF|nr:DNA-dependent ATPase I and helicase II [Haemophilus influenzae]
MRKAVDYMPKKNAIYHHGLSQNYRENVSKKFVYEGQSLVRMNLAKVGSLSNTSAVENEWKMGQKVKHEKFGFGTVINVEGSENNNTFTNSIPSARH